MKKSDSLFQLLQQYPSLCVAYSGGTDSDFLLHAAIRALGKDHVTAIIAKGEMLAGKDYQAALALAKQAGAACYTVEVDAFQEEAFRMNRKDRCYHCKKAIMGAILDKAAQLGFSVVADGKNADDQKVYRPGAQAAAELGIVSPLAAAHFTKDEIRQTAKDWGLSTWNKPSNSCLATRFPYDTLLSKEKFRLVEQAELLLAEAGIPSGRVRLHGTIARIEIPKDYFLSFTKNDELIRTIKAIGFPYVTLDLEGFRSGSMDLEGGNNDREFGKTAD